jgi:hypothetical protein
MRQRRGFGGRLACRKLSIDEVMRSSVAKL